MAIKNRSERWKAISVPTADDFNRIEDNISALENSKEPNISVLPVNKGGTGRSSFVSGHFIVGNGTGGFATVNPENVTVERARCDGSGKNIIETYLGSTLDLLKGWDYNIGGEGRTVTLDGNYKFTAYKYIIFIARDAASGNNTDFSYCMVDRRILENYFNSPSRPLAVTRDGARMRLYYYSETSIYVIKRYYNNLITIYGVK